MATDKKHIAVYLDPKVEVALIAFCKQKGLKSKKGTMFSAGVNAVLAEFFGITNTEVGNIPPTTDNIPAENSNIPAENSNIPPTTDNIPAENSNIPPTTDNIPAENSNIPPTTDNIPAENSNTLIKAGNIPVALISNIPAETIAVEVLPGKLRA
jgi:hypothetical protein